LAVFFLFIAAVVLLSLVKSRKEKDAEDFILAALGLR
jgi:Na+/proline symporter